MIRYLADMHFDDEAIIAYDNRPFNSVKEMNDTLITRWNSVVLPDDLTCILGDFCRGGPERWRELLLSLNGRKILITGNHDEPASVESVRSLLDCSTAYLEMEDEGRHVVLCHYPIPAFRDHYFGWIHLYGHVHSSYEWNIMENTKRLIKNLYCRQDVCRMVNTGAMLSFMDYTPRTLDELASFL